MFSLRQILLFVVAVTPLVAGDASTVQTDLTKVDQSFKQLTAQMNNFNGSGAAFTTAIGQFGKIETALNTTTKDANASSTFTAAQGRTIANYVNTTLASDIMASLTAIENKKSVILSNGVGRGIFDKGLSDIKNYLDRTFTALIAKVPGKSSLQTTRKNLDAAFTKTISYLNS